MKAFLALLFLIIASNKIIKAQISSCPFPTCSSFVIGDSCNIYCSTQDFPSKGFSEIVQIAYIQFENTISIPDDGFSGLQIETLRFNASSLTTISQNAFRGIFKLKEISLTNLNNLSILSNFTIEYLENIVEKINITNSQIDDSNIFQVLNKLEDFKNLKRLSLASNSLKNVTIDASSMINLEYLDLSENKIEKLTAYGRVTELNLGLNFIQDLSNLNLNGLTFLQSLDLDKNKLKILPEEAFSSLSLNHLNLASNSIYQIDKNAFFQISSLTWLDLSYNPIGKNDLNHLDSLKDLILDGCDFENFNTTQLGVKSLDTLSLSNNNIEVLPDDFFQIIKNAKSVKLNFNLIKSMSFLESNDFENLEYLDLSYNQIKSIKNGNFKKFSSLSYLDLSNNLIEFINFPKMESLKFLYLRNNQIKEISNSAFESLENLQELDLGFNSIVSIEDESFGNNKNLIKLLIYGNMIQNFPVINQLSKLIVLDLERQNGKMISIPDYAFERRLDNETSNSEIIIKLSNNYIRNFSSKAFCNRFAPSLAYNTVRLYLNDINKIDKCMLGQFNSEVVYIHTKYSAYCYLKALGRSYNVSFTSDMPEHCSGNLVTNNTICSKKNDSYAWKHQQMIFSPLHYFEFFDSILLFFYLAA